MCKLGVWVFPAVLFLFASPISPSIFSTAYPFSATGYLEPILAVNGCGPGYILDRSPVHHRASLSSSLILLSSLLQLSSCLPFMIQSASLPWSLMVNRSYCVSHVYHLSHSRYQSLDSWGPVLNAKITIFYYYFNSIKSLHE